MVCFCYRRRSVALPRLSADGKFIRRLATGCYQELYDMPNPTAEAQTPVEIGKTNILDQRRRIDRQRELIAGLERNGSPDLVADAVPRLSVRMFGSRGKKRANASSNCAALTVPREIGSLRARVYAHSYSADAEDQRLPKKGGGWGSWISEKQPHAK